MNSENIGAWINPLFHKNDGYQTPVVIEPFRESGNIDVNRQEELAIQRLLSNLLEVESTEEGDDDINSSLRYLKPGIKATSISLDKEFEAPRKEDDFYRIFSINAPKKGRASLDLEVLFEEFNVEGVDTDIKYDDDDIMDVAKVYIIKKLSIITQRYSKYQKYSILHYNLRGKKPRLKTLASRLRNDTSHVTYKLRQAINFLKYGLYRNNLHENFNIESLSKKIALKMGEEKGSKIDFFLPPSFFKVSIYLGEEAKFGFSSLSSGEKQKIYAMYSILYHIKNIDSVYEWDIGTLKYGYVNILLDEVELCFHPELQRSFIYDLLLLLGKRDLQYVNGVNICFVTHSPFILSDIPSENILFLDKASDLSPSLPVLKSKKTFSANIHELLSAGFFMKRTIGEYSEKCILDILSIYQDVKENGKTYSNYSTYKSERKKINYIFDSIADNEIKGIIRNHLKFIETELGFENHVDLEIKQLENRIKLLREMGENHA